MKCKMRMKKEAERAGRLCELFFGSGMFALFIC
jgi:hypothetical protein